VEFENEVCFDMAAEIKNNILQMFDLTREGFVESKIESAKKAIIYHEKTKKLHTKFLDVLNSEKSITINEAMA
jgi:hypothetical protein